MLAQPSLVSFPSRSPSRLPQTSAAITSLPCAGANEASLTQHRHVRYYNQSIATTNPALDRLLPPQTFADNSHTHASQAENPRASTPTLQSNATPHPDLTASQTQL